MRARSLFWFLGLLFVMAARAAAGNEPPSIAWQGSIAIAEGRGVRGPWQQNESRYDFVDDPSVALDERGEAAVVWVDQAAKSVRFQRFAPDGQPLLARPVDVSRRPETFSWLPRVVLAPRDSRQVFVLWQEIIFSGGSHGGEMLFARSGDGGRTFSAPLNLSNSIPGDGKGRINKEVWHNGSYDLAVGPGDTLYAAWTEYDGPLWFSRSTDGGRSFTRPVRVAGSHTAPARAPSLAAGPDGAVYLAWTYGDDSGADIHLAVSPDGGTSFGAPSRVAPGKSYSDAPKLALDAAGVLHLAYAESASGPFSRYQVLYTRSSNGGRSFDEPRRVSNPLPGGDVGAAFPSLAVDSKGRVLVLWELYSANAGMPRGLGWSMSLDGRGFTPPEVVPGSADIRGGWNGSSQGLLMKKLALNEAGMIAVVNSSLKQGVHSRVWMMRGVIPR
jgi:hypothetical protein